MAKINNVSILLKLYAYAASDAGKARMREKIQEYIASGVRETAGGGKIMTEDRMHEAANRMYRVLYKTAATYGLPASILGDIADRSYIYGPYDIGGGQRMVYILVGGERESVYPEGYPNGVDNIIVLLNNGYEASNQAFGTWHSRSSGEDKFIYTRKSRPGLYFVQQAVRDFNGNYGSEYDVTAIVGSDFL